MGELIKTINKINLCNTILNVELNKPSGKSKDLEIHLQNTLFRYSLNEREFLKINAAILEAERQFKHLKGINNE